MAEHDLCLEEYVPFLQERPRTCRLGNGAGPGCPAALPPAGRWRRELPEGCCQISGDNMGGFIVTAWEALS